MKRILQVFSLIMLCGVCAAASVCPRCGGGVLATDAFCAQCRWRLADAYVPPVPRVTASPPTLPPRQTSQRPAAPSASRATSTYVRHETFCTPVKLSILGPVALPSDQSCSVYGLHLGVIGGGCHTMRGLAVAGIGSMCDELQGISVGLFNVSSKMARGLQIGYLNLAQGGLKGCQLGAINVAEKSDSCCLQIGVINSISGTGGYTLPILNMRF